MVSFSQYAEVGKLFDAVEKRDLAAVSVLLETVDVNGWHPLRDGSPLHYAMHDPVKLELVRLLLEHGADHDARHPETGGTPLHQLLHASLDLADKVEAIDLLLAHGADLNVVAEDTEHEPYTAVGIALAGGPRVAPLLAALRERGGEPCPEELPSKR